MIQSMTGYGKCSRQFADKKITIEIKSLNSKGTDINTRISSCFREKELEIRKQLSEGLQRGKIDFVLSTENTTGKTSSVINRSVVQEYIRQLQQIVEAPATELLKMAVRMPDALLTTSEEIDAQEYELIIQMIDQAMQELNHFRTCEGEVLQSDFELRINNIKELLAQIESLDAERLKALRDKINRAVAEIRDKIDENRLEQELIFYLEKLDITEEKVRLANHLNYFVQVMDYHQSNGRKLGFICQEIGREINTLGSKANFAPMQQIVVQMKDELEKIKEQVLNVL